MTQSPEDTSSIKPPPKKPLQFRLVHLIYITSMLAASLALFGVWGILIGGVICFTWACIFYKWVTLVEYLVVLAIIGILIGLMLPPATPHYRGEASRWQCGDNLKQIGIALHNYHETYNSLPPAYLADENGKPQHSWRVLILPFIEENALYEQYDFNEPWDGPNNIQLLDQMPDVFNCPRHEHPPQQGVQFTSYLAITGEHTAWVDDRSITFKEMPTGISNTVLIAEFEERPIPWLQPEDIELTDALEVISTNDPIQNELNHPGGRHVLNADGSIFFGINRYTTETWRKRIQIDQQTEDEDFEYLPEPVIPAMIHYNLIVRIILFVVLMFFPLGWVQFKPSAEYV
ncbi:MAG: hypothetical protein COA78_02200 [Blastopirellula sp.]|nr:MAG: hypothetical protein COA78_02200 [Blastopirellula sp.]